MSVYELDSIDGRLEGIGTALEWIGVALGVIHPDAVHCLGFDYALTASVVGRLNPPDARPWQVASTCSCQDGGVYITWRAPKL